MQPKRLHCAAVIVLLCLYTKYITSLPEYHQDDYDVKLDRVELIWYNKSYFQNMSFKTFFYNRTLKMYNASAYILRDSGTDVTGVIQIYKFASNEYREFPVRVGGNACQEYAKNRLNMRNILRNISNITPCPLKKGFYYINNLAMTDFSHLPPFIPRGQYKAVGYGYIGSDFVGEGNIYGSVVDKPLKWETPKPKSRRRH